MFLNILKLDDYNLTQIVFFCVRRGVGKVDRGVNWI